MAILRDRETNQLIEYDETNPFGEDVVAQNNALVNIINPNSQQQTTQTAANPNTQQTTQTAVNPATQQTNQTAVNQNAAQTGASLGAMNVFGTELGEDSNDLTRVFNPNAREAANTQTVAPPPPLEYDALTRQILGQGLTSKWSGQGLGSAEANAADMARILHSIGITDIKQFGPITRQVEQYVGSDDSGNPIYETQTERTFGNKETGQAVPLTYSGRQTGNFFGGTFSGEGNTGYGVQFDDKGNPFFYTQGASSNDLANLMQDLGPLGQIGLAVATGGLSIPQQIAANLAINVLSGKDIGDSIKNAAISFAGSQIPGLEVMNDGASFIKDLGLSEPLTRTLTNSFQNAIVSGGTALLSGKDIGPAMLAGAATGGVNGAVNALLGNIEGFGSLTDSQKRMATNAVTGVISGKPLDQIVINAAISAANAAVAEAKNTGKKTTSTNAGVTSEETQNTLPSLRTREIESSITNDATPVKIETDVTQLLQNAGLTEDTEYGDLAGAIDRNTADNQKRETIKNTPSFNAAYSLARSELGANKTFDWFNPRTGKVESFSTATAEERPDLTGKTIATTPQITPTVRNYVSDKLSQNLSDPNFNPADLTKAEMAQFVSAYSSATPAQKQAMLQGADQMTFKVIDAMLNDTIKYNPTGKVTNVAPDTAKDTLKAYDKPLLSTAIDVGKGALSQVATDVSGLGVRSAQFLGNLMGQDTDSLAGVQKLLADDKDKSMSKLIGNEKVVAGGIASGIESALSWAMGGPLASVAFNAATVANNSWVEGASKWISENGDVFSSKEEARSQGVTDVRQLTPEENGMRTAAMTSLETVGEMLGIPGMKILMKGIPITGSPGQIINYIKNATLALGNEQAAELATTVAQFSLDKFANFGLNQNASFDDFKQALQDTVLATTVAVGSASGIATAYNSAAGKNTGAISEANRTAVSPDTNTSLLTRGADFRANAGDTSNQDVNPISSEAVDFMAQDSDSQSSILEGVKNQFASDTSNVSDVDSTISSLQNSGLSDSRIQEITDNAETTLKNSTSTSNASDTLITQLQTAGLTETQSINASNEIIGDKILSSPDTLAKLNVTKLDGNQIVATDSDGNSVSLAELLGESATGKASGEVTIDTSTIIGKNNKGENVTLADLNALSTTEAASTDTGSTAKTDAAADTTTETAAVKPSTTGDVTSTLQDAGLTETAKTETAATDTAKSDVTDTLQKAGLTETTSTEAAGETVTDTTKPAKTAAEIQADAEAADAQAAAEAATKAAATTKAQTEFDAQKAASEAVLSGMSPKARFNAATDTTIGNENDVDQEAAMARYNAALASEADSAVKPMSSQESLAKFEADTAATRAEQAQDTMARMRAEVGGENSGGRSLADVQAEIEADARAEAASEAKAASEAAATAAAEAKAAADAETNAKAKVEAETEAKRLEEAAAKSEADARAAANESSQADAAAETAKNAADKARAESQAQSEAIAAKAAADARAEAAAVEAKNAAATRSDTASKVNTNTAIKTENEIDTNLNTGVTNLNKLAEPVTTTQPPITEKQPPAEGGAPTSQPAVNKPDVTKANLVPPKNPKVPSKQTGMNWNQATTIAQSFGIPALANVFYYGKDFSSKQQKLTKEGKLIQEEYDPLSVTKAGAEGELVEDIAEQQKNKENNANDALDLILGESSESMSFDDLLNIVKGG